MKRFVITIAKVWSLIRHDGSKNALKRIWYFMRQVFGRVGCGEILIITGGVGDSARYRGTHVAEELRAHGFHAKTTSQHTPFLSRYLSRFDIFVLHRVTCTAGMKRFLSRAQQHGKTVLFETDDLTFDGVSFAQTDSYAQMSQLERQAYRGGQGACVLEHPVVTHATTSTLFLARALQKRGKEVFVVPNKLSQADVALAQKILASHNQHKTSSMLTIGYFSGSASHNRDFDTIRHLLLALLKRHDKLQLLLVGPLASHDEALINHDRIIHKPYVPRAEYFALLAGCDIVLAPLEMDSDFCAAKSAIKYLEAGLMAVPIVASATEEFASHIRDGQNGFLAHDEHDWRRALEQLITDHALRNHIGRAARTDVLAHHITTVANNDAYYAFLRKTLDRTKAEDLTKLAQCDAQVDTAVIIANWNGREHLKRCLDSLRAQDDTHFHVIVVENGSIDASLSLIKKDYPDVSWVALSENTGFAHANNVGIRAARTQPHIQFIITLNNDTKLDQTYIAQMRQAILQAPDDVVALQPKVLNYYHKDVFDATGVLTAYEMSALNRARGERDDGQYDNTQEIFGPSASAALYRLDALEQIRFPRDGYFDRTYFAYYEDVDVAWRLVHAGYRAIYVPQAIVYHVHSATGKNYSPFKAFHIHRNHYYNIIKNAPLIIFIGIMLFLPVRYVLLLCSVMFRTGASAKLAQHKADGEQTHDEHIVRLVLRAWYDVLRAMPDLVRKRRCVITRGFWRAHRIVFSTMRQHHATLKKIIFDAE